ncbi:hypothetical protein [Paenibacillus naphthalenovorans]|uniref:hypothetical protein n=1 Tax=Paenibacillus naphthalenovorans TaxID=162209 RepID=UPI003D29F029
MSDDNQQQQQDTNNQQQNNQQQTNTQKPEGKVWTDEYVSGLRAEAKEHRLQKKQYEGHLRTLLELNADDEISESHIAAFKQNQQKAISDALAKANARLISAEIKSLDGYDAKLVDRLLDRSKLTIEDDGTVKGLVEAVTELEKEFPQIKVTSSSGSGVNPGAQGGRTELQELEEAYGKARNQAERIAIRNKIHALQTKKQ